MTTTMTTISTQDLSTITGGAKAAPSSQGLGGWLDQLTGFSRAVDSVSRVVGCATTSKSFGDFGKCLLNQPAAPKSPTPATPTTPVGP